jgi:hypothetical protein
MDIFALVVLLMLLSLIIGCMYLANADRVSTYIAGMNIASTDRYQIKGVDETDIKFINMIAPSLDIKVNTKIKPNDNSQVSGNGSTSTSAYIPKTENTLQNPTNTFRDPIPDQSLLPPDSNTRDLGVDLPWDREVGHCEVLKDRDRDLYKTVLNTNVITFY